MTAVSTLGFHVVSKPSIKADTKVEAVFSWEGRIRDTCQGRFESGGEESRSEVGPKTKFNMAAQTTAFDSIKLYYHTGLPKVIDGYKPVPIV